MASNQFRDLRWQKRRDDFFLRGESVHSPFSGIQSPPSSAPFPDMDRIKPQDLSSKASFSSSSSSTTLRRRPNIPLLQFSLLVAPFPPLTTQQHQFNQQGIALLPKIFDGGGGGRKSSTLTQNTRPW